MRMSAQAPNADADHRDDGVGMLTFERIAEDLRDPITAGMFKPGRLLPSQSQLMKTYKASSLTIQKAMWLLRDEGLVISRQGRGTFVTAVGQAREPGTVHRTAEPLADIVQKLNDAVHGIEQLIKDLTRRVSALEPQHSSADPQESE
jgi:DNA-binding GntR family transcriptional regulator